MYLGIDVSKGYADCAIMNQDRIILEENFQLDDTFNGHTELFSILNKHYSADEQVIFHAGVESTGGYENNWYNSLMNFQKDLPVKVARLNPLGVHYSNKADLTGVITDKVSARSIAEYMISFPGKINYDVNDEFVDLRRQRTYINLLKSQKTQQLNQLEKILYAVFPEIISCYGSGNPNWVFELLKKYPTAQKLKKARLRTLSQIPYISYDRATELIRLAKNSVGANTGATMEELIKTMVNQIQSLEKIIREQINLMINECNAPELELLTSFPGIAEWSAINLIIEIGSIQRFSSVKKLASYCGLNPMFKQSGDGMSKARMSKQGRVAPRRVLYMVAMVGIQKNPVLKAIYERHVDRGMAKSAAIGVCMHKALRIVYGMLKNNTKFNPNIDRINQKKSENKLSSTHANKERRYQKFDNNAPISRRQIRKRKVVNQCQNDNIIECGILKNDLSTKYKKYSI